ncbi:MAG: hypothetical protein EOO60_03940 [Hymenobacter sp.]|nr:MAG: hypothetical protein EOO60_03940 [Hymenobacter sp.]
MPNIDTEFNFWKVTDGLDNAIIYNISKEIAEAHYYKRDRKNESAKLYCCIRKQWLTNEEQEWVAHDYNCDLGTGEFIERTTID